MSSASTALPVGNKVTVKNTFIEVPEDTQMEEDLAARFSRSDPTPVMGLQRLMQQEEPQFDDAEDEPRTEPQDTPSPRSPAHAKEISEVVTVSPSSQPLLLQQLLPEAPRSPLVLSHSPLTAPAYSPYVAPWSGSPGHSQEASPEHGTRWTSQTLPLPPGAVLPGPLRSPSPGMVSEASSQVRSEASGVGNQAFEGEDSESENETSPRRKPTRRGGRRARHRKMAALARQQAATDPEEGESRGLVEAGDRPIPTEVSPSRSSRSAGSYGIVGPPGASPRPLTPDLMGSEEDGSLLIGKTALIQGLVRSPEFNGQWGVVESYDPQMHRFLVSVVLPSQAPHEPPLLAKLRRENLLLLGPDAQVLTPAETFDAPYQTMHLGQVMHPGPAADFEDSVGAAMPLGVPRVEPGQSLEEFTSPGTSPPKEPRLSFASDSAWMNQGSAADFEDSVAGLFANSPKAWSGSPKSRPPGMGFSPGPAADFEDSIGGLLTGLPPEHFAKREEEHTQTWQPSLRMSR